VLVSVVPVLASVSGPFAALGVFVAGAFVVTSLAFALGALVIALRRRSASA
jgi:hypothetical protein